MRRRPSLKGDQDIQMEVCSEKKKATWIWYNIIIIICIYYSFHKQNLFVKVWAFIYYIDTHSHKTYIPISLTHTHPHTHTPPAHHHIRTPYMQYMVDDVTIQLSKYAVLYGLRIMWLGDHRTSDTKAWNTGAHAYTFHDMQATCTQQDGSALETASQFFLIRAHIFSSIIV